LGSSVDTAKPFVPALATVVLFWHAPAPLETPPSGGLNMSLCHVGSPHGVDGIAQAIDDSVAVQLRGEGHA